MSFINQLGSWLNKVHQSFANASISGQNITLTRHNGNTVVLTTTDTTYGDATQSTAGLMSATDKTKLDGITAGAEPNQNAFSNVKVGSITIVADGKTDTVELIPGTAITLTPNATNDSVTIEVTADTFALKTHVHDYLPLSGGTLTGNLVLANASVCIANKLTNSESRLMGSPNLANGASFIAYGKDNAAAGAFRIRAFGDYDLYGSSAGVLTWKAHTLSPIIYESLDDNKAVIEYENKFQIVSARGTAANGGTITFAKAFSKTPLVLCEHPGTVAVHAQAHTIGTTGFTVAHSYSSAISIKYIAIGVGV